MSYQELKQNLEGIPTIIGQASKGTLAWPRGVRSGSKLSKDEFRTEHLRNGFKVGRRKLYYEGFGA